MTPLSPLEPARDRPRSSYCAGLILGLIMGIMIGVCLALIAVDVGA